MPSYRLHANCYLDGVVHPAGSVVSYDGPPGSQMEPLDDEGWERFKAYQEERARKHLAPITRYPFAVAEARATGGTVRQPIDTTIPESWREMKGLALTNLAKRLGAPHGVNSHNARAYIEDLERKRGSAPQEHAAPRNKSEGLLADRSEQDHGQQDLH